MIRILKLNQLKKSLLNNEYLKRGKLQVQLMCRGMAWLDTGTPSNMLRASTFIETVEKMQGLYIACLEEIVWRRGYISDDELKKIGEGLKQTDYGKYLLSLIER